jgi:hypothetical protein
MPQDHPQDPSDSNASNVPQDTAAPREQLLKKLNCLIAVLEAAIAKVRKNQQEGTTDPDRLERIRVNLENTLTICQRARITLERRGALPENLPPEVREAVGMPAPGTEERARKPSRRRADQRMSYRDYVELSSFEEYRKFRDLPAISATDIESCDLDKLSTELGLGDSK